MLFTVTLIGSDRKSVWRLCRRWLSKNCYSPEHLQGCLHRSATHREFLLNKICGAGKQLWKQVEPCQRKRSTPFTTDINQCFKHCILVLSCCKKTVKKRWSRFILVLSSSILPWCWTRGSPLARAASETEGSFMATLTGCCYWTHLSLYLHEIQME